MLVALREVLLFGGGFVFGWLWFGHCVLPLGYGIPRAAFNSIRGVLQVRSVFVYIPAFVIWSALLIAAGVIVRSIGIGDVIYNSKLCLAGQFLGVTYGVAAALSRGGRQALNEDFWQAMAPYQRATSPETPASPGVLGIGNVMHGGDRVNDYFLDAVRVYACTLDPAARQAALTAGIVADRLQRWAMVELVRGTAARFADIDGVGEIPARLTLLADEIAAKDWSVSDIGRAKRHLWNTQREYAEALDAFDSGVFRRRFPELFPT